MVRLSNNDTNHYERFIAGQWYEKAIWGLDSKEDFDAVITAIEEYSKFLKDVNQIDEKDKKEENGGKYSLKQAIYIIENIYPVFCNFSDLPVSVNQFIWKESVIKRFFVFEYVVFSVFK